MGAIQSSTTEPPRDGRCFYCGKHTDSFAANPGQWPLWFSRDETGVIRAHHADCVLSRLKAYDAIVKDGGQGR